ncbi:MAG TPA: hypothetical protein LFW21_07560 [Rickettsia endosymbiont of Pyrocoelia pectoralis]|nr:hypothetical protein [Rickettsia endosymbiont of Pyrocoelia pectoralis]
MNQKIHLNIRKLITKFVLIIFSICFSKLSYAEYSNIEYKHPSGATFTLIKENDKYFIQYENPDYKDRSEVPEEIVEKKDCRQFLNWQQNTIPSLFPKFPCPWEEYKESRKVEMCGLTLNIPRAFLTASSKVESDGKETQLMFDFVYPEMKAGFGKGKESVSVWMEDMSDEIGKYHKDRDDYLLYKYWESLSMHRPSDVILSIEDLECEEKKCSVDFTNKGLDKDLNRILYFVKETVEINIASKEEFEKEMAAEPNIEKKKSIRRQHEDDKKNPFYYKEEELYTNDDPKRPKDFITCALGERNDQHSCYAAFFYKNIYFELKFLKKDLINYNNIKKQLLSLIDSWSSGSDK